MTTSTLPAVTIKHGELTTGEASQLFKDLNAAITKLEAKQMTLAEATKWYAVAHAYLTAMFSTPAQVTFPKVKDAQGNERAPMFRRVKGALNTLRRRAFEAFPADLPEPPTKTPQIRAALGLPTA